MDAVDSVGAPALLTTIRRDGVNPGLLGMNKVISEDTLRRALSAIPEGEGVGWLEGRLRDSMAPLLDAENAFDELRNQWGWGGLTTHDPHRCQLSARAVALIHNGWSLFVRLANPEARLEAMTSRPWLMSSVGHATSHAGQTTITLSGQHACFDKARQVLMRVSAQLHVWVSEAAEQLGIPSVLRRFAPECGSAGCTRPTRAARLRGTNDFRNGGPDENEGAPTSRMGARAVHWAKAPL